MISDSKQTGKQRNARPFITNCLYIPLVLALGVATASCRGKRPATAELPESGPTTPRYYLDLQSGWRLRVVTPILKSGTYRLQALETGADSGNLKAGPDYVGYETSIYMIKRRNEKVRIEFLSASAVKDGKSSSESQPLLDLFHPIPETCCLRLLYLLSVSRADHQAAIVAADTTEQLNDITQQVQADPENGCTTMGTEYCIWIPAGISVRPEVKRIVDGRKQWSPPL